MVSSHRPVPNKPHKQQYLSLSPSDSVLKDDVELDFSDVFGPLPEEAGDVVFDEPAVIHTRSHSFVGPSAIGSHSFKLSKLMIRETEDSVDLVECLESESFKENNDSERSSKVDVVKVSGVVGLDDFEVLKVVGQGAFGKVYQVRMKETSEIYAMKVMRKDKIMEKNHAEYMKAERDILTKIDHPFIVQLKYSFQAVSCARIDSLFPGVCCSLSANDIKAGTNIEVDGAPWRVLEFLHVKPGKGAAFVRTKIRNYVNGSTVERTFRAGISVEEANVFKETKQFTYKDGSQFVFMDLSTYEETRLNESDMGDKTRWLKEGMECSLLYWKDKVIDFDLPNTVTLKVVDVDPGLRGDTAQGGSKPATVETGAVVTVPLFVNIGEEILVDTRTGMYMNRA